MAISNSRRANPSKRGIRETVCRQVRAEARSNEGAAVSLYVPRGGKQLASVDADSRWIVTIVEAVMGNKLFWPFKPP
jgi:hypothetical protein